MKLAFNVLAIALGTCAAIFNCIVPTIGLENIYLTALALLSFEANRCGL